MSKRMQDIRQLLRQHKYAPLVCKRDDGVTVRMPHPKLTRPKTPPIVEAYSITRGEGSGLHYNSLLHPEEQFISLPEHAIRLFLEADIHSCCRRVPIGEETVHFLDEGGAERTSLDDLVDPPSTEAERTQEGFFRTLFRQARDDGFPAEFEEVALTHGFHGSYRLIRSFFE